MSVGDLIVGQDLPPAAPEDLSVVENIASMLLGAPAVEIPVEQFLHAGIYVRTCMVPKGAAIVGALIKIPTVVFVSGQCEVTVGQKMRPVNGFAVLRAAAGRRQVFLAQEDTIITMAFASSAKTCADAEKEFTDEWELLTTNTEGGLRGKV